MKKIFLSILMCGILVSLAGCGQQNEAVETEAQVIADAFTDGDSQFMMEVSSNEWKEAYINYVNEHGNTYDSFGHAMEIYKLVNINNDSIPELYINFGSTAGGDV
ncbi:MAG TPA: hypothetical protein IAC27_05735, partial [Candidatus Enterenecus avicola]|nr:hypothetical protein [Candidatus Enterenecus avicola]